jgi:hypothetical protein
MISVWVTRGYKDGPRNNKIHCIVTKEKSGHKDRIFLWCGSADTNSNFWIGHLKSLAVQLEGLLATTADEDKVGELTIY